MIYSINNSLHRVSLGNEEDEKPELLLVNVASGVTEFNIQNVNNFGMLFEAYAKAISIDVVILCINLSIDKQDIQKELDKIKRLGIPHVLIVVANNCYDSTSYTKSDGVRSYIASTQESDIYYDELKELYRDIPVFKVSDVEQCALTKHILKLYGC